MSGICDDDGDTCYDDYPPDDCWHEEYEIDILTGRAECCYCQHSWYLSDAELSAEIQRQADYMTEMEAEDEAARDTKVDRITTPGGLVAHESKRR